MPASTRSSRRWWSSYIDSVMSRSSSRTRTRATETCCQSTTTTISGGRCSTRGRYSGSSCNGKVRVFYHIQGKCAFLLSFWQSFGKRASYFSVILSFKSQYGRVDEMLLWISVGRVDFFRSHSHLYFMHVYWTAEFTEQHLTQRETFCGMVCWTSVCVR